MNCPHCNSIVDFISPINTEEKIKPEQNDIYICIDCVNLSRFDNNRLTKFTDAEFEELRADQPDVYEQIKLAQEMFREDENDQE